jgi:hypothetical protein
MSGTPVAPLDEIIERPSGVHFDLQPFRIPGIGPAMSHLDALSYTNDLKLASDELAELLESI